MDLFSNANSELKGYIKRVGYLEEKQYQGFKDNCHRFKIETHPRDTSPWSSAANIIGLNVCNAYYRKFKEELCWSIDEKHKILLFKLNPFKEILKGFSTFFLKKFT